MAAFDAATRSAEPELMDDDATGFETFRDCLVDLARVNRLSLGYRPTLLFLDRLRREGRFDRSGPVRIVDVGSGYGDMARAIAGWARRRGVGIEIVGVDRNPWAAKAAAEATPGGLPIGWRSEDVFALEPDADVVVSSLFTHHLDDARLVRFLAWSERAARIGWFVNDLRRSRLSFTGFGLVSGLLGMHRFVRHDGPVSIARSFVEDDWRSRLAEAGVPDGAAEIERRFPFRLCVARTKPR